MILDMFSLKDRVAVVTGGARGTGKMIAKVYITSRKATQCDETAAELGERCISLPQDISTTEGIKTFVERLLSHEKKIDILVNNAGAAWGAEFDEFPESGWDKVLNLNLKSLFFLTKALHKPLRAAASRGRPAKVINIASIDGIFVIQMETYSYAASKDAV